MQATEVRIEGAAPCLAVPREDAPHGRCPTGPTTLREGARLGDYEIVGVIGEGRSGIAYLGYDELLEHVAIKEYLPADVARRAVLSTAVAPSSPRDEAAFRAGLKTFVEEAKAHSRFTHPALVRVNHCWEGNGTAYVAMPYAPGPTLASALDELGRAPDEDELLRLLRPLLEVLATVHKNGRFHGDLALANILLTDDGPLLLDLGGSRRVVGAVSPDEGLRVNAGFSAIEQYGRDPSLKEGAWTDLYALAAIAYAAVTGSAPTASIDRLGEDGLARLETLASGRYTAHFLAALDAALAMRQEDRPQSAAEFLSRLTGRFPKPPRLPAVKSVAAPGRSKPIVPAAPSRSEIAPFVLERPIVLKERMSRKSRELMWGSALIMAALAVFGGWHWGSDGVAALKLHVNEVGLVARETGPVAPPAQVSPPVSSGTPTLASAPSLELKTPVPPQMANAPTQEQTKAQTQTPSDASEPAPLSTPSPPQLAAINISPPVSVPTPGRPKPQAARRAIEPQRADGSLPTQLASRSTSDESLGQAAPSAARTERTVAVEAHVRSAAAGTPCREILQVASLGALSEEETGFLKRECHK